jgi:hypothetical protein
MTELVVVDVEPDWFGFYLDGDLYAEGHRYQKEDSYQSLLEGEDGAMEVTHTHLTPDTWHGMDDTLEGLRETYDDL